MLYRWCFASATFNTLAVDLYHLFQLKASTAASLLKPSTEVEGFSPRQGTKTLRFYTFSDTLTSQVVYSWNPQGRHS